MQADNLRTPALIATILAWAVMGFTLLSALSHLLWLVSYSQMAETPMMLAVVGVSGLLSNLAFLPSIIVVMVWTYTAHSNLHRAGVTGLNYSPAWATFSFLVPIVNLFVPLRAMRELANRSAGEPEELAAADVDEIQSWWAAWIGSMIVGAFVAYTELVNLIPWLFLTTPFWATQGLIVLANLLTAASAFFLIKVIQLITRSQQGGLGVIATFE